MEPRLTPPWWVLALTLLALVALVAWMVWPRMAPAEDPIVVSTLGVLETTTTIFPPPLVTTTQPPPTTTTTSPPRTTTTKVARSAPRRSEAGVWSALAACESGGDPTARSASGRYTGAFQFSNATWQSLGLEGSAADHPYEVQLAAAKKLQARSGWGQWPRCSRLLGLR